VKVLIIEDDEFKQRRIAQVVGGIRPDATVILERSVNAGLNGIKNEQPDLILLDMSLTTFDVGPGEPGGRPQNFGGMEILRQMERLELTIPVVVITQHERFAKGKQEVHLTALHRELAERHGQVFKGLIYYNSAKGGWERPLREQIRDLLPLSTEKNANQSSSRRRRRR
jgi:CheY-like chemotaxis protein